MIEDKEVKICSKEEAYWLDIKTKCEESVLNHKRNILIDETLLELAIIKIKETKLE